MKRQDRSRAKENNQADPENREPVTSQPIQTTNIRKLFGTLDTKKTGQQFKDEVRKGWN